MTSESLREVAMTYREQDAFKLRVTLARSGEEQDELETYTTEDIHDAALLRHSGITVSESVTGTTRAGRALPRTRFPMYDRLQLL